jgi:2-amino-4-hydroxy-6-hydroxymethyldihydropteridine diphosphokinase
VSVRYFIGIGSNLGDRARTIVSAIAALARIPGMHLHARSSLWETAPLGPGSGPFLNAAVELRGDWLEPDQLLDELLKIEQAHGRIRRKRWGDRILDLDLLCAYEAGRELGWASERLQLPHSGVLQRDFVLVPLLELDPELVVAGTRCRDALAQLEQRTLIGRHGDRADE